VHRLFWAYFILHVRTALSLQESASADDHHARSPVAPDRQMDGQTDWS